MKRFDWWVGGGAAVLAAWFVGVGWSSCAAAQTGVEREPVVRLAELEIDHGQLAAYRAAVKEEIDASVRLEPGVLTLYAVAVKDHPEQIRLFEMYADAAAYKAHLETAHFRKYKETTAGMVRSLRLVETEPIVLGAKGK